LDDGTAPPYTLIPALSISPDGEGSVAILLSNLLDVPVVGYHTVYVEASDAAGNLGPVSTARFEVIPQSLTTCLAEFAPCAQSVDCCTGRCALDICRNSVRKGSRPRLSDSLFLGGAGGRARGGVRG
jgi:hypothetical protein